MAEPIEPGDRQRGGALWRLVGLCGFAVLLAASRFAPAASERVPSEAPAPADHVRRENPTTAFEPTDWHPGAVASLYVGTLVLLTVCCFVLIAAYPNALPDVDRTLRITPPAPRLQIDPASDLQRFRAEEERRLDTYYWIDQEKGIAHIPISQAMKKLVDTGAPGFPKGPP